MPWRGAWHWSNEFRTNMDEEIKNKLKTFGIIFNYTESFDITHTHTWHFLSLCCWLLTNMNSISRVICFHVLSNWIIINWFEVTNNKHCKHFCFKCFLLVCLLKWCTLFNSKSETADHLHSEQVSYASHDYHDYHFWIQNYKCYKNIFFFMFV